MLNKDPSSYTVREESKRFEEMENEKKQNS